MSDAALQTILARRSIRQYTAQPIAPQEIRRLLEAAMAAPSASNRQPWHFVVVTERSTLDRLAEAHPYGKMLFNATLCIAVCGDPQNEYWVQDCSAATQNILLAATGMGLGSVWLGVHPRPERERAVREILGIPQQQAPLCLISLGYPAEHKEPRTQYDEAKVHYERW
ncbi:MAG: nitroreductase family protein [Anaerolineae bacterium]|nr:nitroreductase family protein [Anaerolineae bacterium]